MKQLFLFLFSIALVSCSNSSAEEQFTPISITPIIALSGSITSDPNVFPASGATSVINNQNDYSIFLNKIISNGLDYYEGSTANVDFTQKTVLTIVYSIIYAANHKIIVDSITEYSNSIEVHYHEISNGGEPPAVTKPYIIIKIPKTEKPVFFIHS